MHLVRQPNIRKTFTVDFISVLVGLHGLFILATTLLDQLNARHNLLITDFTIDVPLLIAISLLYLSSLLRRRKHNAYVVASAVYVFFLGFSLSPYLSQLHAHHTDLDAFVRAVILPLLVVGFLFWRRSEFIVRSDVQAFKTSLKLIAVILLAAMAYGVAGFLLLDRTDLNHNVSFGEAAHRTVDQFDLTTNYPLVPHSRRAHLFIDSLRFISVASLTYIAISLFQPLRFRYSEHASGRKHMESLLALHQASSEEFFKLWPHDKHYFFASFDSAAGLAFQVRRGIALCLGDPVGDSMALATVLKEFDETCFRNDWLPAYIHTEATHLTLYESLGYSQQLIGQEALVQTDNFMTDVYHKKYFRQIRNRFERQGYSYELLSPPHSPAVLRQLREISDQWLQRPGRTERQFVMGYFHDEYLQLCPVLVARDATGNIQAFMNQVPAFFDKEEATFDMLRQAESALGNVNDYLLMHFIVLMQEKGYQRVNLGLSPLVGLDKTNENRSMLDTFLRFAYESGDRFYSFRGLYRFKAKYQPHWRDRYIVYKDGVKGFARTINALMGAMQYKTKR